MAVHGANGDLGPLGDFVEVGEVVQVEGEGFLGDGGEAVLERLAGPVAEEVGAGGDLDGVEVVGVFEESLGGVVAPGLVGDTRGAVKGRERFMRRGRRHSGDLQVRDDAERGGIGAPVVGATDESEFHVVWL